jgi:hypothetical protein
MEVIWKWYGSDNEVISSNPNEPRPWTWDSIADTMQDQPKTVPHVLALRINRPGRLRHKTSCAHSSSRHRCLISHWPNQIGAPTNIILWDTHPHQAYPVTSTDNTPGSKCHIRQNYSLINCTLWASLQGSERITLTEGYASAHSIESDPSFSIHGPFNNRHHVSGCKWLQVVTSGCQWWQVFTSGWECCFVFTSSCKYT